MKTIVAGMALALSLLAQQHSLDKKAIAEIVRYNERWPETWEIRVVDASAPPNYLTTARFLRRESSRTTSLFRRSTTSPGMEGAWRKRTYSMSARNHSRPMSKGCA